MSFPFESLFQSHGFLHSALKKRIWKREKEASAFHRKQLIFLLQGKLCRFFILQPSRVFTATTLSIPIVNFSSVFPSAEMVAIIDNRIAHVFDPHVVRWIQVCYSILVHLFLASCKNPFDNFLFQDFTVSLKILMSGCISISLLFELNI